MTMSNDAARDGAAPLWSLTLAEASTRIAAGSLSPVALLEAFLTRIGEVDDRIHSYIHVAAAQARAAAALAESQIAAGQWKGPLHGIPFAVKDNYDVAGMPATAGSRLRLDHVPDGDADLVAQLKSAGAILIGKLATWEFGTGNGGEYFDLPFPPARNPWDTERFTGGSSTGAGTAVAAGTAMFALGSDTTGSVRLPASATGTVGLIPTPGRLSTRGILPNCWSLDIPGPFAWTVEDCAIIMDALIGVPASGKGAMSGMGGIGGVGGVNGAGGAHGARSLARAVGQPVAGMHVAVIDDPGPGFPAADAALAAGLEEAVRVLEDLGVRITRTRLPIPAAECFAATRKIGPAETAAIHKKEFNEQADLMGFALRDKLTGGARVSAVDYLAAQQLRRRVADAIDTMLRGFDALVTFGTLHLPPRLGVEPEMTAFTVDTMLTPFNLSGHPALVQCTGFANGLPLHWQVVGNRGDEASIIRLASAYERATPWRAKRAQP
jgi:aspartyl-tRNA(Asn)/glutamyl-tRNA(Gln) amidotransferase subunit A